MCNRGYHRCRCRMLVLAALFGSGLLAGPWSATAVGRLVAGLAEGATRPDGGTVVVGLDQEPPTLDPHASPSAVTFQIIASVTESLLYLTPERQLQPWLAESWEVSAGGDALP